MSTNYIAQIKAIVDNKHDVIWSDAALGKAMRNSLDLWLELAEALEDNIIGGNHTTIEVREALSKLKGET